MTWAAERPQIRGPGGLGTQGPEPVASAVAVLDLLRGKSSEGEVDGVLGQLPEDVRDLVRSDAT